ncbi:MAG TPA: CinA family protein [Sphingomonadales bacterium]|nr:CinA family protein [Sphingomonadales bacterium]
MSVKGIATLARQAIAAARRKRKTLATAESCTGGMVAVALTDVAGASGVFLGGFVTYSNAFKKRFLGTPAGMLNRYGAVSEETARAMARGAQKKSKASVSVAVTGIAGPGGGSKEKPVGLVHFAVAERQGRKVSIRHEKQIFPNRGRAAVRRAATRHALTMLVQAIR